ncbi:hypothetical protein C8F04DRAFT_1274966 [Mycena alexandri]|uniref:CxC2-like cysteine cluster KDZ transposase-associated domain-containing protein n=1 Tax=Mycena alexandri TaxID=1745969 RepID=A0AAD6S7E4_9AGAR|nr:hypothetical protein C8F04DRAFT_1274966 [Mycena alexandri]
MARSQRRRAEANAPSTSAGHHHHSFSFAVHALDEVVHPEDEPVSAFVHRVSGDNRRVYVSEHNVEPPSPLKKMRLDAAALAPTRDPQDSPMDEDPFADFSSFTLNEERYELRILDEGEQPRPPSPAAGSTRPVKPADVSLDNWRHKRDAYLSTLVRAHGPAGASLSVCPGCQGLSKSLPQFRCRDCFGGVIYCQECIVKKHAENPLHRLEYWNTRFFVKCSLAALGLRVQMGHPPDSPCTAPDAGPKGFVVLHTNGIHEVAVDFCGCEGALSAGSHEIQLLRAGWYPATHERPQTCATVVLLERFHVEALESKTTLYHEYSALEKLTDNTGNKPPDRYHEFIRMCRQWFHLILLKHGARAIAYSPSGVEGTAEGELAVLCPGCPRPGVNLPEGWEGATPEHRFLYTLFIALDACFRLKRRLVSNELRDPDLGSGWAYMVETTKYREYLRGVTDQKEMNTCSGLAALDYANTKFSRGYSTTGVGMGVCGRHEFVQPNGVGDLQKGERFANMDYVFAAIMQHWRKIKWSLITYDIVCIWKKQLPQRLKDLPSHVRFHLVGIIMRFAIPKMHIHSHTLICQLLFSLNLLLGCAQLEGEGIERAWSSLGAVAACTRDAGPGARHDMVDAQIAGWNWGKMVSFVELLRKRFDRATQELADQTAAFDEFSAQQAARVPEWRQQVLDFEQDDQKPNPYEIVVQGLTEAEVRREFARQEEEDAKEGLPAVHEVGASAFLASGLDLEAEQRRVRVQAELKRALTADMEIDLGGMRAKLNRAISRFRKIQQSYMPAAVNALGEMNLPANVLAEDVPLLLPSALTQAQRERCIPGLPDIELVMRDAQCRTGLVRLRNQLHVKSRLLVYKRGHVRHQAMNTRSRTIVTRNETKVRLHSEKYQTAWEAIRLLNGGNASMVGWNVLKRDDIRCMADAEDLRRKAKRMKSTMKRRKKQARELREAGILPAEEDHGEQDEDEEMFWEDDDSQVERGPENQRQVSWIWTSAGIDGTDAGLEKALRVEWCKAFARTRRWGEEVRLLEEEYRRVGVSLEYEASKWDARAAAVPKEALDSQEAEGAVAYALRQAEMYRDLRVRGDKVWGAPRLARGKKAPRHVPKVVEEMLVEVGGVASGEGPSESTGEEEVEMDLVDRGDVVEEDEEGWGGL